MAITDFQEIWNGRDGSFDAWRATRDYTRVFRVLTNSTLDGPTTILAAVGLPNARDPYFDPNFNYDLGAIAVKFDVAQDQDDPFTWLVRVKYTSSPQDVQQAQQVDQDPLSRPPKITWGFNKYQKPALTDINGAPLLNSAGAWFQPLPEIDDSRPVLTIQRNEATLNTQNLINYQDAVNSDDIWGFGVGTSKISIGAVSMWENNLVYWDVTYTIEFRRDGWGLSIVDAGFYELDANNKPKAILDASGNVPGEPVLLNGAGKRRLPADPNAYYVKTFTVYKQLAYGPLNLPIQIGQEDPTG